MFTFFETALIWSTFIIKVTCQAPIADVPNLLINEPIRTVCVATNLNTGDKVVINSKVYFITGDLQQELSLTYNTL